MGLNILPYEDYVLVETEPTTRTSGGIHLPDTAKQQPQRGRVVAVGPGRRLETGVRRAIDVNVGDTVIFAKYAGADLERVIGPNMRMIKENELYAVMLESEQVSKD